MLEYGVLRQNAWALATVLMPHESMPQRWLMPYDASAGWACIMTGGMAARTSRTANSDLRIDNLTSIDGRWMHDSHLWRSCGPLVAFGLLTVIMRPGHVPCQRPALPRSANAGVSVQLPRSSRQNEPGNDNFGEVVASVLPAEQVPLPYEPGERGQAEEQHHLVHSRPSGRLAPASHGQCHRHCPSQHHEDRDGQQELEAERHPVQERRGIPDHLGDQEHDERHAEQ